MAKTLGQQLDEVQAAISKTLEAQRYDKGDVSLSRAALFRLENREELLLGKIEVHGRDYIPGQNTKGVRTRAVIQFY